MVLQGNSIYLFKKKMLPGSESSLLGTVAMHSLVSFIFSRRTWKEDIFVLKFLEHPKDSKVLSFWKFNAVNYGKNIVDELQNYSSCNHVFVRFE